VEHSDTLWNEGEHTTLHLNHDGRAMIDRDNDLLTIAEAARLLKVGRTTLHRWLKAGRLRAYHIGPRAVRIRRSDLTALMQPIDSRNPSHRVERQSASNFVLQTAIRPLTDEEVQRGLAALKQAKEHTDRMLAERGGKPFDPSWPLIREAREQRSEQI
jgi:excisionase family DNA binding protein